MGPGRASAERNPEGPKRCPGARHWACTGRGTSRRRWSLRSVTAVKRRRRELWLGDGGRGRGGARAETGSGWARCYDALNRGRSLSGDARRRGGGWRPRESLDQVGRCGPRRLHCVRRTARGQRGRSEESKPQSEKPASAERGRGASRILASTCQYLPLPTRSVLVLTVSRPPHACGPQVAVPPRTPSLRLSFPPRACRATPTQSQAPEAPPPTPPKNSMVCHPLGGRGKLRHRRALPPLREDTGAPPTVGGVGTERVKPAGKSGAPSLGADPGASSL